MELAVAVVLGVLQGVLEWLPVSSEGVLTLVMTQFFGKTGVEAVGVSVWLHVGTMFAALLYFRSDFLPLLFNLPDYIEGVLGGELKGDQKTNLSTFLVVSTITSGLVGGLIYILGLKSLGAHPEAFTALVGVALLVTGVLKLLGEEGLREAADIDPGSSVLAGFLQGLAIVPGISRSGSTVFGLLYRDFSGEDAFRLSFLMSVPAVVIANIGLQVLGGVKFDQGFFVAALASFVTGYLSIDVVLKLAERVEVAYLAFVLAGLSFLPLLL